MKKQQQKKAKEFTRSSHQPPQNLPKGRVKESTRDFGFDLDRLAHAGIIIAPVKESLRKENFRMSQKRFEKLHTELRPYIQKNKTDFRDPTLCYFFGAVTDSSYSCSKNVHICFYFRKFFPRVYLTRQHNYFAKRKSYRTSLFIEN